MKVFATTLKRSPERGAYIRAHLADLKLDFEVLDGADYQYYSEQELEAMSGPDAAANNVTKGAIGCAISHVNMLKRVIADGLPVAMVVEDDAAFPPNIAAILDVVEKEIGEDEIITLSYHSHHSHGMTLSRHNAKKVAGGMELLYPDDLDELASTMAYVVTARSARSLLEMLVPVHAPADHWGKHYRRGGFSSLRCLYPMLVKPVPFRTTIDYAASKSVMSRIAAIVRRYKIPVLLQYLEKRSNKLLDDKYVFHFTQNKPAWLESEA